MYLWLVGCLLFFLVLFFPSSCPLYRPCIPSLTCPTYSPDKEVQYVLETAAGFSKKHQLTIGNHVDFELNLPRDLKTNHDLVTPNSMAQENNEHDKSR